MNDRTNGLKTTTTAFKHFPITKNDGKLYIVFGGRQGHLDNVRIRHHRYHYNIPQQPDNGIVFQSVETKTWWYDVL